MAYKIITPGTHTLNGDNRRRPYAAGFLRIPYIGPESVVGAYATVAQ